MAGQIYIRKRHIGNARTIDIGSLGSNAPGFEHSILRAGQFPPVGRKRTPLVAEIAGRGPDPDLLAVDGEGNV
ncbi:hypothetical protein D3C87_2111760 [compost metagenome]